MPTAPPKVPPTLEEMTRIVVGFGGFLGGKGDDYPGPRRSGKECGNSWPMLRQCGLSMTSIGLQMLVDNRVGLNQCTPKNIAFSGNSEQLTFERRGCNCSKPMFLEKLKIWKRLYEHSRDFG